MKLTTFNITEIDFEAPLSKNSFPAVATSICAGCTILIVTIIRISIKIKNLVK